VSESIEEVRMAETFAYQVPGIHCAHCQAAIEQELGDVAGVERVDVDLEAKRVTVAGRDLDDARLRSAIAAAGYDAE